MDREKEIKGKDKESKESGNFETTEEFQDIVENTAPTFILKQDTHLFKIKRKKVFALLLLEEKSFKIVRLDKPKTIIGRAPSCDIVLSDVFTSRIHAEIIISGESAMIKDLDSQNGTFINDERKKEHKLKNGDMIRIGKNILKFLESYEGQEIDISEEMIKFALYDALTGAFNRKKMEEDMKDEFERFKRYGVKFSVIMADIDFFKKINDTYGHMMGDLVLKSVADTLKNNIRKSDKLYRYGGEEFCILLPNTEIQDAISLAKRLLQKIRERKINNISVTISMGVSCAEEKDGRWEEIIKRADEKLYLAKSNGRNRVEY